jgi:hypothetical protein
MSRLFVIGDSFTLQTGYAHKNYNEETDYWPKIVKKKLDFDFLFIDGAPSRDCQTIIDQWIKVLPNINNDINNDNQLIICLPYFNRTRLPIIEKEWTNSVDDLINIKSQFMGTHSYNRKVHNLEIWGNFYDSDFFKNRLEIQELINCSYASIINFYEIIDSLLYLTKSKTIIFSWDYLEHKNPHIIDKKILINEIGFWESIDDIYKKTNGEDGILGDLHWSIKMNRSFAEYITKKIK